MGKDSSFILEFPVKRKQKYYIESDKNVALPSETVGDCKNWKRCRQYNVILGNGLCIDCWDKKTGSRGYGATFK